VRGELVLALGKAVLLMFEREASRRCLGVLARFRLEPDAQLFLHQRHLPRKERCLLADRKVATRENSGA